MKIDLSWTAVIAELRFIKSLTKTETAKVIKIVKAIVIILAFKKWLLKIVTILNLTGTVLAAAII